MVTSEVFEDEPVSLFERGPVVTAFLGWAGALVSLVLVGGLAYWAYDLAMRDARGVPIVRALEGPARVAPETTGGFEAAHQGLAVNSISSETGKAPLAERVMLAPEDTQLTEADQPPAKMTPEVREQAIQSAVDAVLGDVLQDLGTLDEGAAVAPAQTAPSQDEGDKALRPAARPELELVTRASHVTPISSTLPVKSDLDSSSLAAGTRLVQLGSFDTLEGAQAEWLRLSKDFSSYLTGKDQLIERAEFGDSVRFRLRTHGFEDLAEARNFCAVFLADQIDCIPVLKR